MNNLQNKHKVMKKKIFIKWMKCVYPLRERKDFVKVINSFTKVNFIMIFSRFVKIWKF